MDDLYLNSMKVFTIPEESLNVVVSHADHPFSSTENGDDNGVGIFESEKVSITRMSKISGYQAVCRSLRARSAEPDALTGWSNKTLVEALVDSLFDRIRRDTLGLIEELGGISMVLARSTRVAEIEPKPIAPLPEWVCEDAGKPVDAEDLHLGIHSLVALATWKCETMGCPWPTDATRLAEFHFAAACRAHIGVDFSDMIATTTDEMWGFLSDESVYKCCKAIDDNFGSVVARIECGRSITLADSTISYRAPSYDSVVNVIRLLYERLAEATEARKSHKIDDIIDVLKSVCAVIATKEPDEESVSRAWSHISVLVNTLDGFLIGAEYNGAISGYSLCIDDSSYAFGIGQDAGSSHYAVPCSAHNGLVDDFHSVVVEAATRIIEISC